MDSEPDEKWTMEDWNHCFENSGLSPLDVSTNDEPSTDVDNGTSLPLSTIPDYQKCASCGKNDCFLACASCKVTGVGHLVTYYCSVECQKANWAAHRHICKSRQQVANAVTFISELWYRLHTKTYVNRIDVHQEANGIIPTETWEMDRDPRCWTGKSVICDFDTDVIPIGMSQRAKDAVALNEGPNGITSKGLLWVETYLQPFCTNIEEIRLRVKNPVLMVGSPESTQHDVLRITTTGGEVFAVDVASARYGWDEKLYT